MSGPAIIILTAGAEKTAAALKQASGGTVHALSSRASGDIEFTETAVHMRSLFHAGETIIAVMAAGAVIRILAPVLKSKHEDPVVVCVSEDGGSVVPLLGGHHGANQIARHLAEQLGGHAAITTAGDIRFGIALDEPPPGWRVGNLSLAKEMMAAALSGEAISLDEVDGRLYWLRESDLPVGANAKRVVRSTVRRGDGALLMHPRLLVLGIGCERGAAEDHVIELAERALASENLAPQSLAAVVSLDLKADEAAVHAVARHFGLPALFFTAERLERETPRLANPSKIVFAEVGCHGVAEAAALALAGDKGVLIVEKMKTDKATAAVAQAPEPILENGEARVRGHLSVVGIGPGGDEWRSPEVTRLVLAASDLVGYSLYLDLLGPLCEGRERHDFDLGREEDRVRHAMELAGQGKDVALVCSGDAGIYAMATLVFELLNGGGLSDAASRISIYVSPGISALQGAAARAGAPLGHDFCTISLSDLLTPWEAIQMRVKAAAEGDFVIAFYNPVSKRRRTQLAYARDVLLKHRPADTPVILATNLGRDGEAVRVVPLAELQVDDVDMLTVVIVGSSETRTVKTGDGREWVYTPRGYSAKDGTQLGSTA
ncbi:precorrin-3B C(17)-methyltransferase [Pseudahrensia aquimaris]|uniref:Precorrin-3B C(17)-methyltransferase n=1 Tax=Pseudahrensia aquimaris TaxID=744461 RepID=A0ABW3FKG2_9HYPH